jgi:hypothetical protein
MAALNQPIARAAVLLIFSITAALIILWFISLRISGVPLKEHWILICMRHHMPLFEPLLFGSGSAILNRLFLNPKLSFFSYQYGTVIEHLAEEQWEYRKRFSNNAGYFITFDLEASEILRESGVAIGTDRYKLLPLNDLGLQPSQFMGGFQLENEITKSVGLIQTYARPLFFGLSGIVAKHRLDVSNDVGGYQLQKSANLGIDFRRLVTDIVSDSGPKCPIFALNWPALVVNLCAVAVLGHNQVFTGEQKARVDGLINDFRKMLQTGRVQIFENPYALMSNVEKADECLVIGGGTWLSLDDRTKLYPITSPNEPLSIILRYIECFGFLADADAPITLGMVQDAGRIDRWLERRMGSLVLQHGDSTIPFVGHSVWHQTASYPQQISLHAKLAKSTRIIDRIVPPKYSQQLPRLLGP